jgi:hypothetical protein
MTDDRMARAAEFRTLFEALPGPTNARRVEQVAERTGASTGTIRQWLMAEPYRVPSEQMLRLLRAPAAPAA